MTDPTVFIVDDDAAIRSSMRRLLTSAGLRVETFSSASAFLSAYDPTRAGCAVLDVRMPGMTGIELQELLAERGDPVPVIVVTAYADVPTAVGSLKTGAIDFIEKPFDPEVLIERVRAALAYDARHRESLLALGEYETRFARLTPREREIADMVVGGMTSVRIATQLRLSPKTVHAHRAVIMSKMQAGSIAELARQWMTMEREIPDPEFARSRL